MATAVKMDEDSKSILEELQAEIKLRTGKKVTQQDIMANLLEDAYESKSEFVDSFRETKVPLSEAEIERMNEGTFDSGTETREEDIDDILYG